MSTNTVHKFTNKLISETSPYLLQHAHNPVNWLPWNDETLAKAKKENKLILISIGYSACHWCHVMERECFENQEVAEIMNAHFICIKVDREERPDIDQVYMNAVQLMTGSGGWPLNCFALPDGRPIYGGTYFPARQWMNVLTTISKLYQNDVAKVFEYALQLTEGIQKSELVKINPDKPEFTIDTLKQTVSNWKKRFDNTEGGPYKAPKFPLPNNYLFLLRYSLLTKDETILKHVKLTLEKMAFGGIYDQIGGGFSRYSTDELWKAPHFEKMLYDNAQLVTLYSEAYQAFGEPLYKQVVFETLACIKRELTSDNGAFYCALDADSEGVEGKYYVWTEKELKEILQDKFNLFSDYFNVNTTGYWEHNNYILLRKKTDTEISEKYKISVDELQTEIKKTKDLLLNIRERRIKPGLDDKSLCSWNALMLKGYVDAYIVFDHSDFLNSALTNAEFILQYLLREDGGLFHNYKLGRSSINGYLEDYAFTIEAFISLYDATFEEKWLILAKKLTDYVITHFHDKSSGMFFFTSDIDPPLIARKMEIMDNVIPASNSSMAKSLFLLGHYFDNDTFIKMSSSMLNNIKADISGYGAGYSNWAMLMINFISPFYEIAIVGKDVNKKRKEFNNHYLINKIFVGSQTSSTLPLLENKFLPEETLIYVCLDKNCQMPVTEVKEVLELIEK